MNSNNENDDEGEIKMQLIDQPSYHQIDEFKKSHSAQYYSDQFEPFKIPPDLALAKFHGIARRVCKPITNLNQVKLCPCCGLPIENEQIDLNCNPDELAHIGTCYPQYFSFIKLCGIILLIHFFCQALPALVINQYYGKQCQSQEDSFICTMSYINIQSQSNKGYIQTQCTLNFVTIFILIIAVELIKIYQRQHRHKLEVNRISVSDYSIMISKLPEFNNSQQLEMYLESKFPGCSTNINKLFVFFDIKLYALIYNRILRNYSKKISLLRKIDIISNNQKDNSLIRLNKYRDNLIKLNEDWQFLFEKKKIIEDLLNEQNEQEDFQIANVIAEKDKNMKLIPFSGKVLITFKDYASARQIIKHYKYSFKDKFYLKFNYIFKKEAFKIKQKNQFLNTYIKIKKAPEPSDIIWSNIGSRNKKFAARILSYLISYGLIGISFLLLLFIKKMIKDEQHNVNALSSLVLSFVASTLVAGTNTLMGIIIRRCTIYEEHNKQTTYFVSVGEKLTKLFSINMILTTLMANVVNTLTVSEKSFTINLIECFNDFFFLFITNSYLSSLFAIFDLVWGYRLYKRYQIEKQGKNTDCYQIEANRYYEGHPIDMALRYANVLKTIMFTAAVSPLIPAGVILSMIGLCILYWVDKYLLLRRFVCSNFITYKLPKTMTSYLHVSTIFFSLGNLIIMFVPIQYEIDYKLPNFYKNFSFYLAIIGVLLALIFYYTPLKGIYTVYSIISGQKFQKRQIHKTLEEVKEHLKEDYDYYHPVYREYAIRQTLDQKQINEEKKNYKGHSNSDFKGMLRSIKLQLDTLDN